MIACFASVNKTIPSAHGVGNGTWEVFWKYIAHSFQALFKGRHPLKDPYGNDWPVGSRSRELVGKDICGGRWFGSFGAWHMAKSMRATNWARLTSTQASHANIVVATKLT